MSGSIVAPRRQAAAMVALGALLIASLAAAREQSWRELAVSARLAGDGTLTVSEKRPPSPRQGRRGTGSWAPSSVRGILIKPRYTGVVPYGKVPKGTRQRQEKFLLTPRPDLEIIIPDLWTRTQTRLAARRAAYIRDTRDGSGVDLTVAGIPSPSLEAIRGAGFVVAASIR